MRKLIPRMELDQMDLIPKKQIGGWLMKGYDSFINLFGGNKKESTGSTKIVDSSNSNPSTPVVKQPKVKTVKTETTTPATTTSTATVGESGASKVAGGMGMAMNAIGTAGKAIGQFNSISNAGMTTAGANNAKADAGIDMAADAAMSSGIPVAMVIGAAVKGVGIASKALVKTPKAIRDFTVNQNVQNSSAFGGVKSSADAMASRANEIKGQSYSRLWSGGWSKDKAAANQAMYMQNSADSLLQNEKKNNENALGQLDTLSNKVNLQNNGFDLRNMRFGQNGMKIIPKKLNKYDQILTENKNVPFVHRLLSGDTRSINTPGKAGFRSTHLLGSYGNLVMPQVYDNGMPLSKLNYTTQNNMDPVYNSGNKIEFKTEQEATDFANNYKKSQFWNEYAKAGKFQKGGSINVIVNGKLHKELHDVKDNPEFEDAKLTRKGVPVITLEEGGEVKQHAEVERDEIIFRLEVTQKLEGLMELGDKEAMIEAGKLLAYEIVKNTKDSKSKIIKNA